MDAKDDKPKLKLRFFDIAANLTDKQFQGHYYNKQHHQSDIDDVISRAYQVGCDKLLVAGGYLADTIQAEKICEKDPNFYTTVGIHPCRAQEVEDQGDITKYYQDMEDLIKKLGPKCVAIGECGLDYDRFEYASKEVQLKHFPIHFDLAEKYKLPMYLHNRNTGDDFYSLVRQNRHRFSSGVVHSFTGPEHELMQILSLNLYVGVNGCSLKTKENLEVLKKIPLDKIMLETDAPYCEIRNTHAGSGFVKTKFQVKKSEKWEKGFLIRGRNEPCEIIQVAEVVSQVLNVDIKELCDRAYENSIKLFGLSE